MLMDISFFFGLQAAVPIVMAEGDIVRLIVKIDSFSCNGIAIPLML